MKTINLFVDFEFTSLSPDAQPISVGIVSEEKEWSVRLVNEDLIDKSLSDKELSKYVYENKLGEELTGISSKSFYAEFSDFDLNRCDDWVKENVVSKLIMYGKEELVESYEPYSDNVRILTPTDGVEQALGHWLYQFSDYQIQVIVDCGTWDWYHLIQLVAEWDEIEEDKCDFFCNFKKYKLGLPKLPSNISPVPFDLNDLIAIKKGISPKEAFDIYREELALNFICASIVVDDSFTFSKEAKKINDKFHEKHNALFDAKIIKHIYNKLMNQ